MKEKIISIINKPFIRNVTVLATGTAAAQVIVLISAPFITRLYGPEAFGILGVFMAIAQIIISISALTYPIAIVLPRDDRNAKKIIRLSLYICFSIAMLTSFILVFFNEPVIKLLQLQEISSYLFLIPLIVILSGLMQVSEQWLIRTGQFGISAKVTFWQSSLINGSKIGIGLINPITSVLVVLDTLSSGFKAIMMMFFIRKSNYKHRYDQNEPQLSIIELAKKYKDFPLYRAPEVLINSVSQRVPILMLTTFFGPAAAGFYTLGNTVLQKPIQLIGKSVGDVFYPRISEAAKNEENLTNLIKKATLALAGIGIIPFGTIIIFGPWIFSFVFGTEWFVAGKYAQWIGIFLFCEFINKPSIKALPVLSAQLFHLNFTIITAIIRISVLALGYYLFSSDLVAIALFGVSSAILHITLILFVLKKSKVFDDRAH